MKELIPIQDNNGKKAVSARVLYDYLEVSERFSTWCKRMFKYGFIENHDYVGCKEFKTLANQELDNYALTLECAKEISMLQRSEKGKIARQYFIACEEELKSKLKPLSQIDLIIESAQLIKAQEERISLVEHKVLEIEAKTTTRPDYFTVAGYCILNKIKATTQMCITLGKAASKLCKQKGYPVGEVPETRYGKVGSYPESVLKEVFNQAV